MQLLNDKSGLDDQYVRLHIQTPVSQTLAILAFPRAQADPYNRTDGTYGRRTCPESSKYKP